MKLEIKIPDKILELIEKVDDKNFKYVFAAGLALILLLDYFLILGPQIGALGKMNEKIKTISADISGSVENIDRIAAYNNQVETLKKNIAAGSSRIKSRQEISLILERISALANNNGVKIDQISPDAQRPEELLKDNEKKYSALSIPLEIKGGYHAFGKFLNDLENDELFFMITSFSIGPGSSLKEHNIKLELQAIIYEEIKK